jgi:hypothetical protein
MGSRITYDAAAGGFLGNWSGFTGVAIGAPIGAAAGAILGIALAERLVARAWPRPLGLGLCGATLLLVTALTLAIFQRFDSPEEQAGRAVFVVFPLSGAAALLGWLTGLRKP